MFVNMPKFLWERKCFVSDEVNWVKQERSFFFLNKINFNSRKLMDTCQKFTDKVAIKIVDRSRLDTRNLRMLSREVRTLECLQHPYILRLFEGNTIINYVVT
jgi:hypothetical protein